MSGLVLLLGGCAVAVPDPAPEPRDRPVCAALLAALPERVLDQAQRKVRPAGFSAAWGDPPVVLRCGVPQPAGLTASSECIEVNDVGWFDEPGAGGRIYTTIGRAVFVEVTVPSAYAPEVNGLVDVAAAVSAHDPLITPCSG